jgi:hypothetical protein
MCRCIRISPRFREGSLLKCEIVNRAAIDIDTTGGRLSIKTLLSPFVQKTLLVHDFLGGSLADFMDHLLGNRHKTCNPLDSARICIMRWYSIVLVVVVLTPTSWQSFSLLRADQLAFSFSGTISENAGFFFLPAGYRFTGQFVYDTAIPPNYQNSYRAVYQAAVSRFVVDGAWFASPSTDIRNQTPGGQDSFSLSAGDGNGGTAQLSLVDNSGLAFADTSLPTAFRLGDFAASHQVTRFSGTGAVHNVGVIDTIVRLPAPPSMSPIAVFNSESQFVAAAAAAGAPIVSREGFESTPSGDLGNPAQVDDVIYESRGTNGSLIGSFLRTTTSAEGVWGFGNNSVNDVTLSFGQGRSVHAFGLALTPTYPAAGEWRFVLAREDGGVQTIKLPYDANEPTLYQGFVSSVGITSIDLVTVGTSNVAWDIVSHSEIVPEPPAIVSVFTASVLFLLTVWRRRSTKKCRSRSVHG